MCTDYMLTIIPTTVDLHPIVIFFNAEEAKASVVSFVMEREIELRNAKKRR